MASEKHFGSQTRVALVGSERKPMVAAPVAVAVSPAAAEIDNTPITVSVIVRRKSPIDKEKLGTAAGRMTRDEFEAQHGAAPDSVALVEAFAKEFGLTSEVAAESGRRTIFLTGTREQMERAFNVALADKVIDGTSYRVREGAIYLPAQLSGHIEAVLGLDNRPQARPHFRVRAQKAGAPAPQAAAANDGSFTPVQVGQLYGFPATATGAGETIGIIELGGGYKEADLTTYFGSLGQKVPAVTAVLVDGGKNAPTNANSADGEVMLDIEVSAAVAPGAKIVVYFTPNTDQGFTDAISQAVHDTTNSPGVVSISWGGPESSWTAQSMTALDSACQAAAALGVTITVAAGDDGSTDGVTDGANHTDFPASSPHVLGCGGTKLVAANGSITSEVVWNETAANEGAGGGGVSNVFPLPSWQSGSAVPAPTVAGGGRGVPDVAGDADPVSGYQVRVDGKDMVIGGTSAVAPLWAGLIALANTHNGGTAGFINPALYAAGVNACRDITEGNNGGFTAGPGWDACTGQGSPVGAGVIAAIASVTAKRN